MVCIYCGAKTEITNSRHLSRTNGTWRRRHCLSCQAVMTTIEMPDYSRLWVVMDNNGEIRPFVTEILFLSLYESLRHRKTALTDAKALTTTIISKLAKNSSKGQVTKDLISCSVHSTLTLFDKPAAVHYRAYHPASSS